MYKLMAVATLALLLIMPVTTMAGELSSQKVKVTQVKINTGSGATRLGPTAWGIDSTYIGPGDILRLVAIDIYLDSYNRISTVKITRKTYVGDDAILLFNDVRELSIQALDGNSTRPHKLVPITVRTADSFTFP